MTYALKMPFFDEFGPVYCETLKFLVDYVRHLVTKWNFAIEWSCTSSIICANIMLSQGGAVDHLCNQRGAHWAIWAFSKSQKMIIKSLLSISKSIDQAVSTIFIHSIYVWRLLGKSTDLLQKLQQQMYTLHKMVDFLLENQWLHPLIFVSY